MRLRWAVHLRLIRASQDFMVSYLFDLHFDLLHSYDSHYFIYIVSLFGYSIQHASFIFFRSENPGGSHNYRLRCKWRWRSWLGAWKRLGVGWMLRWRQETASGHLDLFGQTSDLFGVVIAHRGTNIGNVAICNWTKTCCSRFFIQLSRHLHMLLQGEKRSRAGDSRAQRWNLKPHISGCNLLFTRWGLRPFKEVRFLRWSKCLTKCFVCSVYSLNANHWDPMPGSMYIPSFKKAVYHQRIQWKSQRVPGGSCTRLYCNACADFFNRICSVAFLAYLLNSNLGQEFGRLWWVKCSLWAWCFWYFLVW